MDAATLDRTQADRRTGVTPRARIGLIIPSVNSMSEPQFNHFAPPGLAVHVARARVAGPWKRPLPAMADEITMSAQLLSDVAPDLIVFHCTDTSMTQGPQGEGRILDIVTESTGIPAVATSRLVLEALQTLKLKKLLLLTPYLSNKPVIDYLTATGHVVVHDIALGLKAAGFRQSHTCRMGRACPPARPTGRRRHLPELHQHHADRGHRRDRTHARQAGREQQPGGAVGLRARLQRASSIRCRTCRSSAA